MLLRVQMVQLLKKYLQNLSNMKSIIICICCVVLSGLKLHGQVQELDSIITTARLNKFKIIAKKFRLMSPYDNKGRRRDLGWELVKDSTLFYLSYKEVKKYLGKVDIVKRIGNNLYLKYYTYRGGENFVRKVKGIYVGMNVLSVIFDAKTRKIKYIDGDSASNVDLILE
jgi:hypothetical protein